MDQINNQNNIVINISKNSSLIKKVTHKFPIISCVFLKYQNKNQIAIIDIRVAKSELFFVRTFFIFLKNCFNFYLLINNSVLYNR